MSSAKNPFAFDLFKPKSSLQDFTSKAPSEIDFFCALCGSPMKCSAHHSGKTCECPKCRRFVPVPPSPASTTPDWAAMYPPDILAVEIVFPCPECGSRLGINAMGAGISIECPPCKKQIKVPHLGSLVAASTSAVQSSPPASGILPSRLSPEEFEFLNRTETNQNKTPRVA